MPAWRLGKGVPLAKVYPGISGLIVIPVGRGPGDVDYNTTSRHLRVYSFEPAVIRSFSAVYSLHSRRLDTHLLRLRCLPMLL